MRHAPEAIRHFLDEQPRSGLNIANFCTENGLKVPTFYSWKKKYREIEQVEPQGFCKITPRQEIPERSLRLPSGLRLELVGLSIQEIAELILEIEGGSAERSRSTYA